MTLQSGDLLILASDGLETLHPRDVEKAAKETQDTKELLQELYELVLKANLKWNTLGSPLYTKPDNISIILYRHP
jgi:serine/threonine protein phosphatase PrpC